jgi:hypothetical protein
MVNGMGSIRPMRQVDAVKVTVPNPLRTSTLLLEALYLALALGALIVSQAITSWKPALLFVVVWVTCNGIRLWRGHRKWLAWRDGPPIAGAGTPAGSLPEK